jgi:hypothetical protein
MPGLETSAQIDDKGALSMYDRGVCNNSTSISVIPRLVRSFAILLQNRSIQIGDVESTRGGEVGLESGRWIY